MYRKLTWLVFIFLLLGLGHIASAAASPHPPDGATEVSTDVTLSWDSEYGVISYDVYFGTSNPPELTGNQDANSYDPGTLEPGTTYFWQINEVNDLDPNNPFLWEGDVWSFTTTKGPKKATNPSPADGAEDVPLDTGLSWDPGSGATSQDVYFGTSSSPPFVDNQTQSDYSPGTLEPDTRYWWQIDTVRQIGEWFTVVTGDLWSFTTAIVEATDPYPADGAEDVPLDIVLSWNPGSGATSQDVYFGTSSSPPLVASQTQSDYSPGTLEPDTRYWWHIDEIEADGTVVTGDVWSFTTMSGPEKATNPSPSDGAEDVPVDIALSWAPASGATSYDVHFGTSSSPAFVGNQSPSDYNPGTLEPGVDYYWQIDTVKQIGELLTVYTGDVWSFTTMSGPEKATNPSPADGAADVPIAVVLGWSPGSGATSHDVYFGTSSSPAFVCNQSSSDYNPGTLEPGVDYYWQIDTVKQIGEFFMVYTGDLWSFTTDLDTDEHTDFECFFYQMDFNLSGTAYIDTEWGSVDFTFAGQEPIMYFNLTVNGTWQVQNIPVLSIEGVGVEQTMTYFFDLGTQRGVDVTSLSYDYAFTPDILDTPPGMLEPAPVADDYVAMWPGFGGSMPPLGPARPLIGGEAVSSDKKYAHKNFPNQECGPGECVPAAVSNSLHFLNNENDLGLDANDISIDTMKEATGWDQNGAPLDTWWEIKKKYMEDNGYPITTRKITDMNELAAEIDAGQDVEITESWLTDPNDPNSRTGHVTALIGITPLEDGRYSLDVADDRKQGEPGGCDNPKPYTYDPKTGTIDGPGYITNFEYAVVECPYILLDDFELYGDDFGNRIFETWIDGLGYIYPLPGHPGNGTGAIVGNSEAPIAEQTIVYEGSQSMPFSYDNSGSNRKAPYSETGRTWDVAQDWTRYGVKALSLWFYGDPNNVAEPMYLAVEESIGHTAVVYHDDPNALLIDDWTEWNIDLKDFADQGVNLTGISSITIGFGDRYNPTPGGTGTVYFDNITLSTDPCPICPIADDANKCKVLVKYTISGIEGSITHPSPWTFAEDKLWPTKPVKSIDPKYIGDKPVEITIRFLDGDYSVVTCTPGDECEMEITKIDTSIEGKATVTVKCTPK